MIASLRQEQSATARVKEEFDIEMDEDAALAVKTVGDAVAFIGKTIEEQKG